MKTYPVNLGTPGAGGMPTSLFDPRWQDPAVAARVAFTIHCRVPFDAQERAALAPAPAAPLANLTDARTFALTQVFTRDDDKSRFKGGSFGELHRRYAFGTHTVNFHAQAVSFGADSLGRFALTATVGRFDGPWGNDATLAVSFYAGAACVGTASWTRVMDPTGDHRVVVVGQDEELRAAFDKLDRAEVFFTARTGVETPKPEGASPKLSRAKKMALEAALATAKKKGDAAEVARIEAQLHEGKP